MPDTRDELVELIHAEAAEEGEPRFSRLLELAEATTALPKDHPTTRVLRHLRPFERRKFPDDGVRLLVAHYGTEDGTNDPATFFDDLVEAIHPGMGRRGKRHFSRPWWATLAFSPAAWLWWTVFRGAKKRCPDCAEWVKTEAAVCRFCGHQFR